MSSVTRHRPLRFGPWQGAVASSALLSLAGRPWQIAGLSLGWLALVAFVPLLSSLPRERRPLVAAASLALVAFVPAFVAFEALGPFAPVLLPLVTLGAALPFAAVGAVVPRLCRLLGETGVRAAFPLLWLAAEALPGRTWLLGRYAAPLLAVGVSQAGLPAMQLARFAGLSGVGLGVLACNALLATALAGGRRAAAAGLLVLGALVAAAVATAPASQRGTTTADLQVRVVQRALPDAAYAAAAALPGARQALVSAFVRATARLPAPTGPTLTIWPEGALPGPLPADGATGLEPYLTGLGPLLAGAPARTVDGIANAVYAWQDGALRRVYAKRRLAPLTESALVTGSRSDPIVLAGVRVAPLLCFEVAFPALARQAARAGAQLLAVLTNDDFGRGLDAPANHLRLARFRAVETGLPLAFASNAGPSAIIDPAGRILARSPPNRAALATAAVEPHATPTPYLRWGDWPSTLALAGTSLLALLAGARGGARSP